MGGFLAGAPACWSVAGICNMSARCEWADKDWAAPGSSRGQEIVLFPSVPGTEVVVVRGNSCIAACACDRVPYVWMEALPVCCWDGGQPGTRQLSS